MRAVLVVAGVAGLLITAGCGQDEPQPVTAAVASTPTPASVVRSATGVRPTTEPKAPAPARLTVPQARARYLAVTRAYNVALERFEKAANDGASTATLRARAKAVAAANLAESRQLVAIPWPATVDAKIRQLAKANLAARTYWLKAADADSTNELAGHVRRATKADDAGDAAGIRRLLGLPKYDESDYS